MTYQVLARKWRPQRLKSVVGQEHVITAIKNSILLNKVHHSYLLSGTRGVGKTTIARLFAKLLNCEASIEALPCGCCKVCLEIEKGCFLDVVEIDAASRTKVEDTREFLDDIYYSPVIGKFKIYLIDEVHMLSRNSMNALLKILEEPPIYVKFILITTEQQKIPATVLSRCIQFYLRPLSVSQIFNYLIYIFKQENIEIEPAGVKLIAYFAKGSMRDALSLSEQAIIIGKNKIQHDTVTKMLGIVGVEHALLLLESLFNTDIKSVMYRIKECAKLDINWDYFLSDILALLQKISVIQVYNNNNTYDDIDNANTFEHTRLMELSQKVTSINVQLYYKILLAGKKELFYAPNYRMGFEMLMLRTLTLLDIIKKNNSKFENNSNQYSLLISNIITNQGSFIIPPEL